MNTLQQKTINGIKAVYIPDSEWLCPKCGAGHQRIKGQTGGLVAECDDDPDLPSGWMRTDDPVYCDAERDGRECGWMGDTSSVYRSALRRRNLVKCPCCKGSGLVKKTKAERLKTAW